MTKTDTERATTLATQLIQDYYLSPADMEALDFWEALKDTELTSMLAEAEQAKQDWVLVSVDYAQLEVYIFAELSKDPHFVNALNAGLDIHSENARKIYNLPADCNVAEEYPDLRWKTKEATFAILYGATSYGLAKKHAISKREAQAMIDDFFTTFPGARDFIHNKVAEAYEFGYVSNPFQRKRRVTHLREVENVQAALTDDFAITSRIKNDKGWEYLDNIRKDYRVCLNTPVQGGASDLVLRSMRCMSEALKQQGLRARLLLNVHDEIVAECHREDLPALAELMRKAMVEDAPPKEFAVKLRTDCDIGPTYEDLAGVNQGDFDSAAAEAETKRAHNDCRVNWKEHKGGTDKLVDPIEAYKDQCSSTDWIRVQEIFLAEVGIVL